MHLHYRWQERKMAVGEICVPAMSFCQKTYIFPGSFTHCPPLTSDQLELSHLSTPRWKGVMGGRHLSLYSSILNKTESSQYHRTGDCILDNLQYLPKGKRHNPIICNKCHIFVHMCISNRTLTALDRQVARVSGLQHCLLIIAPASRLILRNLWQ